jgi:phage-related tail protein
MTDEQAVAKGHRAEREYEETAEGFEKVRQAAVKALINTKAGEEAVRERLVVTCQILDAVQSALMDVVNSGQLAEHAIRQRDLLRR